MEYLLWWEKSDLDRGAVDHFGGFLRCDSSLGHGMAAD